MHILTTSVDALCVQTIRPSIRDMMNAPNVSQAIGLRIPGLVKG